MRTRITRHCVLIFCPGRLRTDCRLYSSPKLLRPIHCATSPIPEVTVESCSMMLLRHTLPSHTESKKLGRKMVEHDVESSQEDVTFLNVGEVP